MKRRASAGLVSGLGFCGVMGALLGAVYVLALAWSLGEITAYWMAGGVP